MGEGSAAFILYIPARFVDRVMMKKRRDITEAVAAVRRAIWDKIARSARIHTATDAARYFDVFEPLSIFGSHTPHRPCAHCCVAHDPTSTEARKDSSASCAVGLWRLFFAASRISLCSRGIVNHWACGAFVPVFAASPRSTSHSAAVLSSGWSIAGTGFPP